VQNTGNSAWKVFGKYFVLGDYSGWAEFSVSLATGRDWVAYHTTLVQSDW